MYFLDTDNETDSELTVFIIQADIVCQNSHYQYDGT